MLRIEKSYDRYSDFITIHRNGELLTIDDAVFFMEKASSYFGHDRFHVVREHAVKVTPRKGWLNQLFRLKDRTIGCIKLTGQHLTAWGEEFYAKEKEQI